VETLEESGDRIKSCNAEAQRAQRRAEKSKEEQRSAERNRDGKSKAEIERLTLS
jgi:hypothetical protein